MEAEDFSSATILIVDDDSVSRDFLRSMLVSNDFQVIEVVDGQGALDAVAVDDPDIVLLDVRMPDMDGIEVCRRIREDQPLLPVVFVTAADDRQARLEAKALGADDFLVKPIDEAELLLRIGKLLYVRTYQKMRETQRELLERDLEQTREQLLRAERLAALGTLAAGVGHELGNLAMVSMANLQELQQSIDHGEVPPRELADSYAMLDKHLKSHAKHLLHIAKPGPDFEEAHDLRAVIESTVSLLNSMGKTKHMDIRLALPDMAVMVSISRTRAEQILMNLLGNAADAIQGVVDRPWRIDIRLHHDTTAHRAVCAIEDTGHGISKADQHRILEPYFTTKPPERGTGLGLPVVKSIVEGYHGTLTVRSETNRGTCVTFDLPAAQTDSDTV